MDNDRLPIFGYPEDAKKFHDRHPKWEEVFTKLANTFNRAFVRQFTISSPADKFVYFFGRLCVEDFMEILTVCGNGYGAAGMKLLRSMYEHAVTLRYLFENPDEITLFMEYHRVQQHKLMRQILETFGKDAFKPELIADVEAHYAEVKSNYMVKSPCCGKERLNHTWNKLDFVSMAKKTGGIGELIVPGYFIPLRHAHSSFGTLSERLEYSDTGITFAHETDPGMADEALMIAHHCVVDVLEVQNGQFHIDGLAEEIQMAYRGFLEVWIPDHPLLASL